MRNTKLKIIYSLRVYVELQQRGFKHISMMPNPKNENLNCWIFEATDEFLDALDEIIGG